MKIITILLFCLSISCTTREYFIPKEVNVVLGEITPEQEVSSLLKQIKKTYPNADGNVILWSGWTGIVSVNLDDRYSLMLPAYSDPENNWNHKNLNNIFVHKDITINILDKRNSIKTTISFEHYGKSEQEDREGL